jgi:hypothetical protein
LGFYFSWPALGLEANRGCSWPITHSILARGRRALPLQDDIAFIAYWYQTLPTRGFPQLPDRDDLEVI